MDTRHGFSEVLKLIDLVLTLPVTSVENERFFSCMKRVKTYLRNRCGNERLSDLLVIACLPEDAKCVDTDVVINDFAQMKPRRYPLM
jgi:hAT family C-terminal dimerisation region